MSIDNTNHVRHSLDCYYLLLSFTKLMRYTQLSDQTVRTANLRICSRHSRKVCYMTASIHTVITVEWLYQPAFTGQRTDNHFRRTPHHILSLTHNAQRQQSRKHYPQGTAYQPYYPTPHSTPQSRSHQSQRHTENRLIGKSSSHTVNQSLR